MNLQDFVKDVLIQLDGAVEEARNNTSRDIRFTKSDSRRTVEFDISVAVTELDAKTGKAGIQVLPFAKGEGELNKEVTNSTVSRIVFGFEIDSKTKEEDAAYKAKHTAQVFKHNSRVNNY